VAKGMQNASGSCIAVSLAASRTRDPFDVGIQKEKPSDVA